MAESSSGDMPVRRAIAVVHETCAPSKQYNEAGRESKVAREVGTAYSVRRAQECKRSIAVPRRQCPSSPRCPQPGASMIRSRSAIGNPTTTHTARTTFVPRSHRPSTTTSLSNSASWPRPSIRLRYARKGREKHAQKCRERRGAEESSSKVVRSQVRGAPHGPRGSGWGVHTASSWRIDWPSLGSGCRMCLPLLHDPRRLAPA